MRIANRYLPLTTYHLPLTIYPLPIQQCDQPLRDAHGIMAQVVALVQKVRGDDPESHRTDPVDIGLDEMLPNSFVFVDSGLAWNAVVHQHVIESFGFSVQLDGGHVLGR